MELKTMTAEELQMRQQEISAVLETEDADLDALETEAREIKEELELRVQAQEQRQRILDDVAAGTIETEIIEEAPQEERHMELKEIRASQEYAQAYLNAIKTGDDTECRALLTTEATAATGYVPVPVQLESEIKTAWEEHKLLGLVKHSAFKGDVKVAFELSAGDAVIHLEGDSAPTEETVTLGVVTITNQMIKKWITVSDEALENTTVDTIGYLYKELAHKITEKAEAVLVAAIIAAPTSASSTAVSVPTYAVSAVAADTIVQAMALLAGSASNLYIAMNRATYPAFRALELSGNYAIDVFEGLKDRIVFTDQLTAYGSITTSGDTFAIIGDFGNGFQANFPNGYGMSILKDPYSLAERDLVKLVGRELVGMGVVADKHFVKLTKTVSG